MLLAVFLWYQKPTQLENSSVIGADQPKSGISEKLSSTCNADFYFPWNDMAVELPLWVFCVLVGVHLRVSIRGLPLAEKDSTMLCSYHQLWKTKKNNRHTDR